MSEWRSALAFLLLSSAGRVGGAHAQSTAEFRRRVDELRQTSRRVHETLRTTAQARTRGMILDTLRRGPLTLVVVPSLEPVAAAALDSTWPVIERTYGRAVADLGNTALVLQALDAPEGPVPPQPRSIEVLASTSAGPGDVAISLRQVLATQIQQGMDSGLARWVGGVLLPMLIDSEMNGITDLCLQGQDAACRQALRHLEPALVSTPLGASARLALLDVVVRQGGTGAYDRLLATRGQPIDARLAAAAGMPADSVFAAWRHRVLSAQPLPVAVSPGSAWVAVGWCLLLAVLALRSSRWR